LFLNNSLILTDTGSFSSSYLIKLTENGNIIWFKKMEGSAPQGVFVRTDKYNNIYTAGRFCGQLKIDTLTLTEYTSGYWCGDGYVTKMTPQGDLVWATQIGNTYTDENIYGFGVSPNGSAYFTGNFTRQVFVNSDSMYTPYCYPSYSVSQVYFAKLSTSGKLDWYDYPITNSVVPSALTVDNNENVYFTGMWNSSFFVLSGDSLKVGCGNQYSYHFYLIKNKFPSSLIVTGIKELLNPPELNIFPNPSTGKFTIQSTEKISSIEITNLLGEKVFTSAINHSRRDSFEQTSIIDLSDHSKGIYFVQVLSEGQSTIRKIVLN
jgi:hypothetical protein